MSHVEISSFSFCAGSIFWAAPNPSLEYALVFVSLSTTLNLSICCKHVPLLQSHQMRSTRLQFYFTMITTLIGEGLQTLSNLNTDQIYYITCSL